MNTIRRVIANFIKSTKGASFLEYTVLLGGLLIVGIGIMWAVGTWAAGEWNTLDSTLDIAGRPACCANAAAANVPGNCCN